VWIAIRLLCEDDILVTENKHRIYAHEVGYDVCVFTVLVTVLCRKINIL